MAKLRKGLNQGRGLKYIKEEKKKGIKLDGGIVIFEVGSFWINRNENFRYTPRSLSDDWQILDLSADIKK